MTQRSLTIALILSLAVNLFLVSGIAGMFLIGRHLHAAHPRMMAGQPLWAAGRALPPEARMDYFRTLHEGGGDVREQMRQARRMRHEAFASLGAEPFDAGAVRRRLAEARRLETEARGRVEGRLVDFAAALPPPERRALAHGLVEFAPGPGRGMRREGPPPASGPPPPGEAP